MNYFFHQKAEKEFLDAVNYYESQQKRLGIRFSEDVYIAIQSICKYPYAWEKIDEKTRRCLTKKFPYGVLYRIKENHIRIMAVMNLNRKPKYWKNR